MMNTKIFHATFILLLLASLTACEQEATQPEEAATTTPIEATVLVETTAISSEAEPTGESWVVFQVVDTGQRQCYNDTSDIECMEEGSAFFGQDAQYTGAQPSYMDNGDGTITDLNTGLMWQQDPGAKKNYADVVAGAEIFDLAGYDDWRLPTIKELYSLILFNGTDASGCNTLDDCPDIVPFIDTDYFVFSYGDTDAGERVIDAQYWSSNEYVATTMGGAATIFGVNFADGRIKGYPRDIGPDGSLMTEFVRYVRKGSGYGINDFMDNGDDTIIDQATGLQWMQADSTRGMNWEEALAYCENLDHAGYDDWRLPNAKELQSIVDYTRSPDTTNSAAIDPIFSTTSITDEGGETDYPFYWTSTTHAGLAHGGSAVYIAFGEALGYMGEQWIDVHGAGAQRSDPKSGDPANWPTGRGPQGDAIRIYNYARCVRGGGTVFTMDTDTPSDTTFEVPTPSQDGQLSEEEPPQEAIDACREVSEGVACEFIDLHGTVSGTCTQIGDQLTCVPEGGSP